MIGLLGKKVGMTQLFAEDGRQVPVTVLKVGPCHVTCLRTKDKDGYSAVQLGFDPAKESRVTAPRKGQFKKAGVSPVRFVREIRTQNVDGLAVGAQVGVDNFQSGDFVDVIGTSIGKGFQGHVKRHHFKAGEKAHGTKMGRESGSIGASAFPSRVVKGMRMAGHMGDERITVQNLKVVKVDADNHLLLVHGAVPGVEEGYLIIKTALKRPFERKWKVAGAVAVAEKESKKEESEEPKKEEENKAS